MIFDFDFWVCDFYQASVFANLLSFPILAVHVIPAAGMNENTDNPSVSALKPKIPDFWLHAANVWVTQVNAQFWLCRITADADNLVAAVRNAASLFAPRLVVCLSLHVRRLNNSSNKVCVGTMQSLAIALRSAGLPAAGRETAAPAAAADHCDRRQFPTTFCP